MRKVKIKTKTKITVERSGNVHAGTFISFEGMSGEEHFAIGFGEWESNPTPIVRIHSECMTGDVFGSTRCDCGAQLTEAIQLTSDKGGVILYLRQEGRGIGLFNKFDAYNLQDEGYNTYEANQKLGFEDDLRDFTIAAEMLKALSIEDISLHSNNGRKQKVLEESGIRVSSTLKTGVFENPTNRRYLLAKKEVGNHSIQIN